jgi:hypothetical protein
MGKQTNDRLQAVNVLTEVYPVLHVGLHARDGKLADNRIILKSSKYPTDNHQTEWKTTTMKYLYFVMTKERRFLCEVKTDNLLKSVALYHWSHGVSVNSHTPDIRAHE